MTKAELVDDLMERLSTKYGATVSIREATRVVDAFLESITETLASGERIEMRDFGVFVVKDRAARKARNPRTKTIMDVPAKKSPVFTPSMYMRARINEPPD